MAIKFGHSFFKFFYSTQACSSVLSMCWLFDVGDLIWYAYKELA